MVGNRQPERPAAAVAAEVLGYVITLVASTLLFLWLGGRVDGWLGTEPWFALLGALIGAAAGFYHMIHHLTVVPRERDDGGSGR